MSLSSTSLLRIYTAAGRMAVMEQLQYRAANLMFMVHLVIEPVIYLVVWSAVAEAQGGQVAGYTAAQFAGYYMVWTLVRQFNLSLSPNSFHWRIKEGRLAGELLRPIHPIQTDFGYWLGFKVPQTLYWLPVAALLWLAFRPELSPEPWHVLAFPVALMLAFLLRFLLLWGLGLVCFWTERVDGVFESYFAAELIFSGRLVPLEVMPAWVQNAAAWLPFQWTFYFPIESLLGRMSASQFVSGALTQAAWVAGIFLLLQLLWKQAVQHFTAVGT
ncbi:MAG: ABC-2 family transporter protein [Anaerolineales bacterium]|nr:ABC-2 family transporter protein [Anaerolineales bacterium]